MANVLIFTRGHCSYCLRAKTLLTQKKVAFEEINIDLQPEKRAEMISLSQGGMTVPQIFINAQIVGGCDDLMALEYRGELDNLLIN